MIFHAGKPMPRLVYSWEGEVEALTNRCAELRALVKAADTPEYLVRKLVSSETADYIFGER